MSRHPLAPAWAQAAIIADLEENTSDAMTDYFGSRTVRSVIIGWSKHTRDLFPEMRAAAARFEPTAHLGPGKDRYIPRVVLVDDVVSNGSGYWKGSQSHWHSELDGGSWSSDRKEFETQAEAEAYMAEKGEPDPITFNSGTPESKLVHFAWKLDRESVEHREKWSMGHGYYLGYNRYSGWQVSKRSLAYGLSETIEVAPYLLPGGGHEQATTAQAPAAVDGVTMTLNRERNGVELRFPAKPSDAVRDQLKANGWRWSRFSACWYTRDTPAARAFAEAMTRSEAA